MYAYSKDESVDQDKVKIRSVYWAGRADHDQFCNAHGDSKVTTRAQVSRPPLSTYHECIESPGRLFWTTEPHLPTHVGSSFYDYILIAEQNTHGMKVGHILSECRQPPLKIRLHTVCITDDTA